MSSQGSGSYYSRSYELDLLEAWGNWSGGATSHLYFNSVSPVAVKKGGLALQFPESEILIVDRVVAGMPKFYRGILVGYFIKKKLRLSNEQSFTNAIGAFSENLSKLCEE